MALTLVWDASQPEAAVGGCQAAPEFWFPHGGVQTGEVNMGVRFVCGLCGRIGPGVMDRARLLPIIATQAEAQFVALHGAACPWGGVLAEDDDPDGLAGLG